MISIGMLQFPRSTLHRRARDMRRYATGWRSVDACQAPRRTEPSTDVQGTSVQDAGHQSFQLGRAVGCMSVIGTRPCFR